MLVEWLSVKKMEGKMCDQTCRQCPSSSSTTERYILSYRHAVELLDFHTCWRYGTKPKHVENELEVFYSRAESAIPGIAFPPVYPPEE